MTQLAAWVVNNKAVKISVRVAEYKIEGPHSRALAKPTWDKKEGRGDIDFNDLLEEEKFLNDNIDFTFSAYHALEAT